MFLGVGVGAFAAGFFHVFTHAFFKACLFLGAGSVIHAMHARVHDDDQAQDIRNVGGLRKWLPLTHWTFFAATLAIIGFPFTSGFFSKDEILYRAFVDGTVNPLAGSSMLRHVGVYAPPPSLGVWLYGAAVFAATMTAFYMCRLYFLTFWGDFRGWTVGRPSLLAKQEVAHEPAHAEDHGDEDDEAVHEHHEDLATPGYPPHESPWQMTVPLVFLGAFSIFTGFLNPGLGVMTEKPMEHWLEPVFKAASDGAVVFRHGNDKVWAEHLEWPLTVGGIMAFLLGTLLAYWMYIARKGEPAERLAKAFPGLHQLVLDKWRVDELYEALPIGAVDSLAEASAAVDVALVDGFFARLTSLVVAASGTILRAFQTGVVHTYGAMMALGLAAVVWFLGMPHPKATIVDAGGGDYVIHAAPGVGYGYRWDGDGDGKPDTTDFGGETKLKVHLDPGKSTTVHLEVKNAFGLVKSAELHVERPAAPISSL